MYEATLETIRFTRLLFLSVAPNVRLSGSRQTGRTFIFIEETAQRIKGPVGHCAPVQKAYAIFMSSEKFEECPIELRGIFLVRQMPNSR